MFTPSQRLSRLPGYPLAELPARKRQLIEQGVDLIDPGLRPLHAEALVPPIVAELQRRRDAGVAALRESGFLIETPVAAWYLWAALPPGVRAADFSRGALEREGVVRLPGSAFGAGCEGFFRVAVTPPERIREGVLRLGRTRARLAGAPA